MKKIYVAGIIGLVCLLMSGVIAFFLMTNFNFNVTVEAGERFNTNKVWKNEISFPCTVAGEVKEEVGTYKCLVKVWGLIPMNVTVEVLDRTKPTVVTQGHTIAYGETCVPEDFIAKCEDVSDVVYSFVSMPDTTKLGQQPVAINVTDSYNNNSIVTATLTVKGVQPSYTIAVGEATPPASVFAVNEDVEVSYVTEFDATAYNKPGEHTIQLNVQGAVETVTLILKDQTAPVIHTSTIKVVQNGTISYKKNIRVTDNCDEDSAIILDIDNSEVNISEVGTYVVHCQATDTSGNVVTKDITVQVVEPTEEVHTIEEINKLADKILASIINDSMTMYEKAYAIYVWTRGNIGYLNDSPKGDWMQGAYDGMVKRRGDCFTYAATAKALLERIGLEPIVITKEKASWTSQNNHYWLLLDVGEGYYHFDATRRADGTWFFMWTDAQLLEYSNNHRGSHNFTRDNYPPIQ